MSVAPVRVKDNLKATLVDLQLLHQGLEVFLNVETIKQFDESVLAVSEWFSKAIKFRDITDKILGEEKP